MGTGRGRCWLNLGFTDLSWPVMWSWNKDHPSHHQHVSNSWSQEFRRSHPGRIYRMPSMETLGWNPVQYYNYGGPKGEWSEKKKENQERVVSKQFLLVQHNSTYRREGPKYWLHELNSISNFFKITFPNFPVLITIPLISNPMGFLPGQTLDSWEGEIRHS